MHEGVIKEEFLSLELSEDALKGVNFRLEGRRQSWIRELECKVVRATDNTQGLHIRTDIQEVPHWYFIVRTNRHIVVKFAGAS